MRSFIVVSALLSALAATADVRAPRVVLNQPTVARVTPPTGPFNVFVGPEVQSLPKGTELEVVGRRSYGGFGGNNVWLQVKPAKDATSLGSEPVWVYGGTQSDGNALPSGISVGR